MGLSEKIIIKEETYLLLLILTVCVIDTIYLLENVVCFNSIVLPCRFGILKVTLNVDLSLGGLNTWCNIMRSKNGLKYRHTWDLLFRIWMHHLSGNSKWA